MATVNYSIVNDWGAGFTAEMKVKTEDAGLDGWTVSFDAPFKISNIWNAEIVSHTGNHYVVRNAPWNSLVQPGQAVSFGFQADSGAAGTMASSFSVNGTAGATNTPPALPALSIVDTAIIEGTGGDRQLAFKVDISKAVATPISVRFTTADGTAIAGADYTNQSGMITFAAGETTKTIFVPILGDAIPEANETFTLTLSAGNDVTLSKAQAVGTIINDDSTPTSVRTSVNYAVSNDWGAGFTADMKIKAEAVGLNGWTVGFDAPFKITNIWNAEIVSHKGNHYVVQNAAWNSHVAQGQTVSFGFQADSGAVGTIASDFSVNGAVSATNAPPTLPAVSIADASIIEGTGGDHLLAFKVEMSKAAAAPISVHFATTDGTAAAGSDYTSQTGTITFAAGETIKTLLVPILGDAIPETNETFTLNLSAGNDATLTKAHAVGTIINDDPFPITDHASGWLSTQGNQIVDASGHSFQIEGVNWFGFESSTLAPHGLWTRSYKDMMSQMKDLGFNSIRLPFSSDTLHSGDSPNGIDLAKNPDLQGLSALQIMDKIVDYAGQVGLKIILDHHRSDSGAGTSGNGLWYDSQHSQAQWISDWQMLARRYANDPTVIGGDLHNEPYNGVWGGGGANDWAAAAEQAGNAIGAVNPNWLIFVEGVGSYKGESYWWGGNLMGVKDRPIELNSSDKLVYSAHDYPNSVYPQTWFQETDFAQKLPQKFDQMWGYIYKDGIAPIYVGEFGSALIDPKDAQWLDAITAYMSGDFNNDGASDIAASMRGMSWSYWSWNPNSGDTGGILGNDWNSVNQNKLNYLEFG